MNLPSRLDAPRGRAVRGSRARGAAANRSAALGVAKLAVDPGCAERGVAYEARQLERPDQARQLAPFSRREVRRLRVRAPEQALQARPVWRRERPPVLAYRAGDLICDERGA